MGGEIMTCQELQSQLLLKMSGELPDEQVRQLDAHLASCAACRQEAALLSRMVSSTKFAVQRGQPSSAVLAQIETAGRARLETVAWQRQMFRRWVPAATNVAPAAISKWVVRVPRVPVLVSVPVCTLTVSASAVPVMPTAPLLLSVPRPRWPVTLVPSFRL